MFIKIRLSHSIWRMHKIDKILTFTKGHQYEIIHKDKLLYKEILDSLVRKLVTDDSNSEKLTILDYNLPAGKMVYEYGKWYPTDEDLKDYPNYIKGVYCKIESSEQTECPNNHIIIYSGTAHILSEDGVVLETI